jgi:hypothetical protein
VDEAFIGGLAKKMHKVREARLAEKRIKSSGGLSNCSGASW